jgi:membrane-bound serine protease (ClpP class)
MVDSNIWRTVFLSSICEIIIIVVIAVFLMAFYPALILYILLGTTGILVLYFAIKYRIYKPIFSKPSREPRDDLIGQEGVTITDLAPRGQVKLRNEVWSARSTSGNILQGIKVKVLELDGIQLIVEPLEESDRRS